MVQVKLHNPAVPGSDGSVGVSGLFILLGRWSGDGSNSQSDKVLGCIRPGRVGGGENFFPKSRKISAKAAYIGVERRSPAGLSTRREP